MKAQRACSVQTESQVAARPLVAGSSLMVYSRFRFVRQAPDAGLPIAIVNLGRSRGDELATLKVGRRTR